MDPETARERPLPEVVRNPDLQNFVTRALASPRQVDGEIILRDNSRDRLLQVTGTTLRDLQGKAFGALIVLNDVTRLRRLEQARRDFVANVSHELKTPITSIKGFVETLLDGAMQEPEDALKFLQIIARHADRLNEIIDDLLSLSRIEQDSEQGKIALAPGRLKEVLNAMPSRSAGNGPRPRTSPLTSLALMTWLRRSTPRFWSRPWSISSTTP